MDRRAFISSLAGLMPALALVGCATPSEQDKGSGGPRFSETERKTIRDYYAQLRARKPAGEIPPQGVKPGDRLAPGQRPNKLPSELDGQLPALPSPYTRLVLGADVILVNRDTHDILDVIAQVAY